ncbi:MAG: imm11 family protein [Planctomycetaceae bacterium]
MRALDFYDACARFNLVECLDRGRSEVQPRTIPEDSADVGYIRKLALDAKRAANAGIFRLKESTQHLIVSRRIKGAFEKARITGVRFEGVKSSKRRKSQKPRAV